jgi:hypothetical protein
LGVGRVFATNVEVFGGTAVLDKTVEVNPPSASEALKEGMKWLVPSSPRSR